MGHNVAQLVEVPHFKPKCRQFEYRLGYWKYLLTYSFQPHCGPGVDAASNTNECQGCLVGDEGDCA